jgi:hypothetical protein
VSDSLSDGRRAVLESATEWLLALSFLALAASARSYPEG